MDKDINYDIIYNGKNLETLSISNDREILKYVK